MKKILFFVCLSLITGCSKEKTQTREILLSYPETEVNIIFTNSGSISPDNIFWDGEPGTFSISSSSDILEQNLITFDSVTGEFSWGKNFPLGTYVFNIAAQSGSAIAIVEIVVINTFQEGTYAGGFIMGDNPDFIDEALAPDYTLQLKEDGTVFMDRFSNPGFMAAGNWSISKEGGLSITFISNLSAGAATYMTGSFFFSSAIAPAHIKGEYGPFLNEKQEIENPTGLFRFD